MRITTLGPVKRYPIDFPAAVRELLRRLPAEHLVGISRITISEAPPLDEAPGNEVLGQYSEAYDGEPAFILLYPEEMAKEVPFFLRPFPLVWRVLLAETLFHEVGHHYQRFTHGIRKPIQEDHAETYALRHARAVFPAVYRFLGVWGEIKSALSRGKLWWLETRRSWAWISVSGLYELGRMYWMKGDWSGVVEVWGEVLSADPEHVAAREWLPKAKRRLVSQRRRLDAAKQRRVSRSGGASRTRRAVRR